MPHISAYPARVNSRARRAYDAFYFEIATDTEMGAIALHIAQKTGTPFSRVALAWTPCDRARDDIPLDATAGKIGIVDAAVVHYTISPSTNTRGERVLIVGAGQRHLPRRFEDWVGAETADIRGDVDHVFDLTRGPSPSELRHAFNRVCIEFLPYDVMIEGGAWRYQSKMLPRGGLRPHSTFWANLAFLLAPGAKIEIAALRAWVEGRDDGVAGYSVYLDRVCAILGACSRSLRYAHKGPYETEEGEAIDYFFPVDVLHLSDGRG